jgi:hypothetical protein
MLKYNDSSASFVAQIEGQIFVSFWDTNKYTDAKNDAK